MSKYIQEMQKKGLAANQFSKAIQTEITAYENLASHIAALKAETKTANAVRKQELEKEIGEQEVALNGGDEWLCAAIQKFDTEKYAKRMANMETMHNARRTKKESGGSATPPAQQTPQQPQQQQQQSSATPIDKSAQQQAAATPAEEPVKTATNSGGGAGKVLAVVGVTALAYFGIAWKKDWWPFNRL